jgi:hypothetical protein
VQSLQAPPFRPQTVLLVPAWHTPLAQQPLQVEGPQERQEPPEQVSPVPHAGPEPHRHSPFAEQPSARLGLHGWHVPPPLPHLSLDGA